MVIKCTMLLIRSHIFCGERFQTMDSILRDFLVENFCKKMPRSTRADDQFFCLNIFFCYIVYRLTLIETTTAKALSKYSLTIYTSAHFFQCDVIRFEPCSILLVLIGSLKAVAESADLERQSVSCYYLKAIFEKLKNSASAF